MEKVLNRMEVGNADESEIAMLEEVSRQIDGHTVRCGDSAMNVLYVRCAVCAVILLCARMPLLLECDITYWM